MHIVTHLSIPNNWWTLDYLPNVAWYEYRFIHALSQYYSPRMTSNCRWTLLYMLGLRESNYPASEEEILELLKNDYQLVWENLIPSEWDIAIWHEYNGYSRVFHAWLVLQDWSIKSKEWPELNDPISTRTSEELTTIIESDCRKLVHQYWTQVPSKFTTLRFYRKKQ